MFEILAGMAALSWLIGLLNSLGQGLGERDAIVAAWR